MSVVRVKTVAMYVRLTLKCDDVADECCGGLTTISIAQRLVMNGRRREWVCKHCCRRGKLNVSVEGR